MVRRPLGVATVRVVAVVTVAAWVGVAGCASAPSQPPPALTLASPPASSPSAAPVQPVPAPTATPSPRPSATRDPDAVTAGVYAAAGVRQWLSCAGRGPLTVVVVAGLGAWSQSWAGVLPSMRAMVRTCVYDRPGLGRSPARPSSAQVVDAGRHAAELWALLRAAGERGPYVVLGHSYGGLVARAFVRQHRTSVAGLLLAEGVTPYDPTLGRYWHEAGHRVDMGRSSTADGDGPQLGSLPLLVMSASEPDRDHLVGPTYGQPQSVTDLWVREQAAAPQLSSDSVQVVARSGHVLHQDDPPAVVAAVRVLLAAVRTGQRLGCSYPWSTVHASCR